MNCRLPRQACGRHCLEHLAQMLVGIDDETFPGERFFGHDLGGLDREQIRGEIVRLELALALVHRSSWQRWARERLELLERELRRRGARRAA